MPLPTNDNPEPVAAKTSENERLSTRLANLSPAQKELLKKRMAERRDQQPDEPASSAQRTDRVAAGNHSIAIVGMGCRFPGANSIDEFWDLIDGGIEAVGPIPENRWERERFYDPTGRSPGKMSVNVIGAIDNIDRFDPAFFGIAPREASRMDPQQRLLLEVTWETFEQAGIPIDSMAGSNTGVFIGIGATDYSKVPSRYPNYYEHIDAHIGTGNALSIAAGRISYLFDFRGPSFIVDTACSSALVAIHNAVVSLLRGECDAAVAGGVNLILSPETTIAFSKARMLSPDGHCRPFDDGANGYVRGEGCGIVLLKRFEDAIRDRDQVLGIIRGSAVNQDGRTSGITAPSGQAQVRVIGAALKQAGLSVDDISYVEAHGTGTPLGDPIELMALGEVFSERNREFPPVRIGSVKANIGHTETASGIAGLLKVLEMFRHGHIPAQANFDRINSNVRLSSNSMKVADSSESWSTLAGQRPIAGISSFGFGGTNAHLIVESPGFGSAQPPAEETPIERRLSPTFALPVSAMDEPALRELANRFADLLDEADPHRTHDICGSAAIRRSSLSHRAVAIAESSESLASALRHFGSEKHHVGVVTGRKPAGRRPRVAMLFTGQGSQYVGMASRLTETLPSFASALRKCNDVLDDLLPIPLVDILAGRSPEHSIDHTSLAQAAICSVQCALVDSLSEIGVVPDIVAGHSIGEIAALYAAGALSREDAMRIAVCRGETMGQLPSGGTMAAILTDADVVQSWIDQSKSTASIATMNGPGNTVIAGSRESVETVITIAEKCDTVVRRLAVSHAFHSPMMEPAVESLRQRLDWFLTPICVPSHITFLSSVTGRRYDQSVDVDYWIRHLLQPVRFTDVIDRLYDSDVDLAIEIGPTPQLSGMLRRAGKLGNRTPISAVPTLNPKQDDYSGWIKAVAQAWCVGVLVNWADLDRQFPSQRVRLPTYPFQRERYWHDPPSIGNHGAGGRLIHPMLGSHQSLATGDSVYSAVIRDSDPNFLSDHIVSGSITVPAAAWLETLRAAAAKRFPEGFELRDIEINRALFLEPGKPVSLQTRVQPGGVRCKIRIDCRADDPEAEWQTCANAVAVKASVDQLADRLVSEPSSDAASIDPTDLYRTLADAKLQYGDYFRVLDDIVTDGNSAKASLHLADELRAESDQYRLHPTLLDGALQLIALVVPQHEESPARTFLPVGAKSLRIASGGVITSARVHRLEPRADESDFHEIVADLELLDDSNMIVAQLHGVRLKSLQREKSSRDLDPCRWIYGLTWMPKAMEIRDPSTANQIRCFGPPELCAALQTHPRDIAAQQWVWSAKHDSGDDTVFDVTQSLLEVIQSAIVAEPPVRLSIVTGGAYRVLSSDEVDPVAAAVVGLTRVAMNEHPQQQIRILDVPNFEASSIQLVQTWLASDHDETELAVRAGQWLHPRMVPQPRNFSSGDDGTEIGLPRSGSYRMRLDGSHRIEGLWSQRIAPPRADRDEVTLEINAVGLNFSDVLKSMGLYPGIRDKVVPLGIEVCGTVTQLGEGVDRFRVGDRVMGVVPHGFASHDATKDYLLAKVPIGISDEEAASIPIVFLTAHYALTRIGRLRPGESVLIHAGAGGVGLAAIQVALSIGATVYTTAGSPVKRQLLAELGVDPKNIFDSRDIRSIEAIAARSGNRGVDVVLNSLPGDWIDESLRLLTAHGRFLEIGKTDIYQNRALGLAPFQDNLSYSAIDLDRLFRNRADETRELFAEVVERFHQGVYQPLPITSFRLEELPSAMRFMAARRNIGKIVVTPPKKTSDVTGKAGVHLITGGSGAIAQGAARRLIERGATAVALVARSEASNAVRELQIWAAQQGARCFYLQADCSDQASIKTVIATLPEDAGKIIGVIHAAGLLDDGLISTMSADSLYRVLQPKVSGALVLDRVTSHHPVESFLLLGSVAAVFGSPGQANYAAANAFLEGFAENRRQRGLPASIVHWGPWASAGMADDPTRLRNLASRGLKPLDVDQALDLLVDALDRHAPTSAVVVDADFGRMLAAASVESLPSILRSLKTNQGETGLSTSSLKDTAMLSQLIGLSESERVEQLGRYFANQLGNIMSMDPESIDPAQPLGALGLDSLMAIELKNTIEAKLDLTLPISKFMNEPTLELLAETAAEILSD